MVRWGDPFPRNDAWERNTYAGCSVQPRWSSFTSQFFAKMAGKVIAVVGEEVVGGSLKLLRDFFDYVLEFVLWAKGEAL